MLIFYSTIVLCFMAYCIFAWFKPGWSVALFPLAMIIALITGGVYEDMFPVGFAVALFPVTILIVRFTPTTGSLETPWYKVFAKVVITVFYYLLILAIFVLVFQFLSPILFIIFLVAVYQFSQAQKYGLVMDIITTIGTAIRQSLPLATALTTAAVGQKKKAAGIFNNIAYWLTQGWPLSEAMRRGYPKCPSSILASVTTAEKMDQLPKAIESLQSDLIEKVNDYKIVKPVNPWYPLVVMTWTFMVVMGLTVFIVPTFTEVISDMSDGQVGLPASTQSLLTFSNCITANKGLNAFLIFSVILGLIIFVLYVRFRRRNPDNPRFLSRLGDRLKWMIPVWHWFEKTIGNLYLVQTLRVGINAGYPINTILRNALGLDVNICYQNCIKQWLNQIEAGEDISTSAKNCGMDQPLAWAFDQRINKGSTPQVLEGMEDIYRCKYYYHKNVLAAISWPMMILGLGFMVGYVVFAMFMGTFSILFVILQQTIPQ